MNAILRAEHAHEKEYVVTLDAPVTPEFLAQMAAGVEILGTRTRPCTATRISRNTFRIVLTQGLNRQIRRMCEALGHRVTRLQRVRIMHLGLDDLEVGEWRDLTAEEVAELHRRCARGEPSTASPERSPVEPALREAEEASD